MSTRHTAEELQADDLDLHTVTDIDELNYLVRKYSHETGVHVSMCETHEDAVRTVAGLLQVIRARDKCSVALTSPLHSARAAMREAGVPNCELGGGVSTSDAIRWLAAERDRIKRYWCVSMCVCLALSTALELLR